MKRYANVSITNHEVTPPQEKSENSVETPDEDITKIFLECGSRTRSLIVPYLRKSISCTHLRIYHGDTSGTRWGLMNHDYSWFSNARKEEYMKRVDQIKSARANQLGLKEKEDLMQWLYDEVHGFFPSCQVYNIYTLI
jgi:hypothetical protein